MPEMLPVTDESSDKAPFFEIGTRVQHAQLVLLVDHSGAAYVVDIEAATMRKVKPAS